MTFHGYLMDTKDLLNLLMLLELSLFKAPYKVLRARMLDAGTSALKEVFLLFVFFFFLK